MTALAALWRFSGSEAVRRDCEQMLRAQQIYAPDPAICWSDGVAAVGRRLFRLLPEDVHDRGPVISDDGHRVLIADVRLDNRDELADALDLAPREADRLADAALLMKALDRWDDDAADRLVGDFAFVLWDAREHRMILARDILGMRPLHYHRGDGFLAVASMPKGLHALPEIPLAPNREATAQFLALMPESMDESFFEGVRKVLPAHVVTMTREGESVRKYWHPDYEPLRLRSAAEYEEALREQLDRAVGACLRGTGDRVASTLSGGLDSSAVATTAAKLMRERGGTVTAFTCVPREGFNGRGVRHAFVDEGPLAAMVAAAHPNIEHVIVRPGDRSPLTSLDRYFFLYDRPFLNLCNGVWGVAMQTAVQERRHSVMLIGALGNMTVSYDGLPFLTELLARGRLLRLAKEAYALKRNGTRLGTIAAQTIGPFLPAPVWRGLNRVRGKARELNEYSAIHPDAAAQLELARKAAERGLDFSYRPRRDSVLSRLWVLGRVDPGNYNKGGLGGYGIDGRDPTGDRRLVEFCLKVPVEQYMAGGVPRSLLRRALADRVPHEVRWERRKGYQAADWYEALDRDEISAELERIAATPAAEQALDTGMMQQLVSDWPSGGWHEDRVIGKYRFALLRGISAGHFLRKASGSNR